MSVVSQLFGNMFSANPAAATANQPNPAASVAVKTPGNMPAVPEVSQSATNPLVPVSTTVEPGSPVDAYADLWKTDPNAKPQEKTNLFPGIDPAAIAAVAGKHDFLKVITPEQKAAITKGGPEAAEAMVNIMQAMSQKGFGDSAVASTKLIESALEKQQQAFLAQLPGIIKSATVKETLRSTDPIFSNPAVKPMLDMMQIQVAQKHPDLSAAEQAKMAQDYVRKFAETVSPSKSSSTSSEDSDGTDWSKFIQ